MEDVRWQRVDVLFLCCTNLHCGEEAKAMWLQLPDGDGWERALRERGSGGWGDCSFDGSEELVL